MTTRVTLSLLFGKQASQDHIALTVPVKAGSTAEGMLSELIYQAYLLTDFALETEDGERLTTESLTQLRGGVNMRYLEIERLKSLFKAEKRIDRFFVGLNYENI